MPKTKSKRKKQTRPPRPRKPQQAVSSSQVVLSETPLPLAASPPIVPSFSVPFISDRMNGFFQVAAVGPFFITSWVSNGLVVNDFYLFTVFFAAMVLGVMASTVHQKRDEIPFPEQLQQIFLAAAGVLPMICYAETKSWEVSALLAAVAFLRVLCARVDPRSLFSFALILLSLISSSSLMAPLGAYLHERHIYYPFMVFGFVPSMILGSALVIKYTPLFLAKGWGRSQTVLKKDGTEVIRPAGISRLFILLLLSGPMLPAVLVPFGYLANSFVLPVLALTRSPNIAEDFLHNRKPEAELFFKVTLLAILSEILLLGAAFL